MNHYLLLLVVSYYFGRIIVGGILDISKRSQLSADIFGTAIDAVVIILIIFLVT